MFFIIVDVMFNCYFVHTYFMQQILWSGTEGLRTNLMVTFPQVLVIIIIGPLSTKISRLKVDHRVCYKLKVNNEIYTRMLIKKQ